MSTVFKRQNGAKSASIPNTTYELSPATLKNFPSSVVNGVTAEGGLFSLTFKSVACANLVENLDWMRQVVFAPSEVELSRINPDKFVAEEILQDLKADVEKLQADSPDTQTISKESQKVNSLKRKLDEIVETKSDLSQLRNDIIEDYKAQHPDKELLFSDGGYKIKKIEIPNLKIDSADETASIPAETSLQPSEPESQEPKQSVAQE